MLSKFPINITNFQMTENIKRNLGSQLFETCGNDIDCTLVKTEAICEEDFVKESRESNAQKRRKREEKSFEIEKSKSKRKREKIEIKFQFVGEF